jgi:hypothetical protein
MMNSSKLKKVGIVLALSAIPFYAHATSSRAGLEACAEAMVNDLATNQGKPVVYNLSPESKSGRGGLGHREVFHLDAMSADGEEVVARMDCVVNNKAEVTKLTVVPLDGEDARIRATTFN